MAKKAHKHGGAWKVAYADFVTAMMALFMVLWIVSQEDEILIFTSQYFQNPFNSPLDQSTGILNSQSGQSPGEESQAKRPQVNLTDMALLHSLARELFRLLDVREEELESSPVEIQVENDGLRITLYQRSGYPVFDGQSDRLTDWGQYVLQNLAWVVERHSFHVRIDAHTGASTLPDPRNYGVWELTTDQAATARRALVYFAVPAERFDRLTGFGDTQPLPGLPPEASDHQRLEISLVLD